MGFFFSLTMLSGELSAHDGRTRPRGADHGDGVRAGGARACLGGEAALAGFNTI